jgi:hypothetical protein
MEPLWLLQDGLGALQGATAVWKLQERAIELAGEVAAKLAYVDREQQTKVRLNATPSALLAVAEADLIDPIGSASLIRTAMCRLEARALQHDEDEDGPGANDEAAAEEGSAVLTTSILLVAACSGNMARRTLHRECVEALDESDSAVNIAMDGSTQSVSALPVHLPEAMQQPVIGFRSPLQLEPLVALELELPVPIAVTAAIVNEAAAAAETSGIRD